MGVLNGEGRMRNGECGMGKQRTDKREQTTDIGKWEKRKSGPVDRGSSLVIRQKDSEWVEQAKRER